MRYLLFALILSLSLPAFAQRAKKNKKATEEKEEVNKQEMPSWGALKFRSVGPATHSGRIADFAVNPKNPAQYYVAVASGGIWKTDNAGTTYYPIFDSYSSYSVGCLHMDPNNENIIWAGTGENNNQRSVAYGDGVYKSMDGGKSWKNMGLQESEHIGMIQVDPNNSNVIYVAAYGPLWSAGGERGLYKSSDGGENWKRIFEIDEHTGVSEVHLDPRNPEVIYAVSHQRRRHVFTYLGGGPGSGVHKSTDGGKTWKRLKGGLPQGDYVGRIGLDISPANPDYVYAIVEASNGQKGFYRSIDRGESWEKRSNYATSGNYYQEIICDLYDKDKVFSMNTWLHHTEDGGKSFKMTGEKSKHVDNHCIWIDPNNSNHWLVGCDGGIYETWDHAQNWNYKSNLPLTQYYKVAVDNSEPFYYIYGGTQDNNSMGGPSRTTNAAGIVNSDWFITNGGDGFESQIDPKDPNIIYAQAQYGWLVRYDKKSGQRVGIKPLEAKDDPALRWNWDAPLLISPHNHKRLYFCANKIYRSNNRGDDWTVISPDLTRQLDRNKMEVMGRVWSMDAVMKSKSTTIFGNIVAFDESPKKEGLLYAGTDDGLIQVSEDAGKNWRKIEKVGDVPEMTYVNALVTSLHDENTVYAVFNNHKKGDFKPYIYKSTDNGQTWKAVHGDLPERGTVYDIAEDHKDPNLLFAGTEFGAFFSNNGGENWHQLKAGLPTIAVKDLEIQRREDDLVLATFGRSFYVLDNYTPLRHYKEEDLSKDFVVYPIKDAWMFIESSPLGLGGKANQGESFYTAANPPVAATFSYLFNDTTFMSIKDARQKREQELIKAEKEIPFPTLQELHAEDWENAPYLIATITNSRGEVVRRIKTQAGQGLNRLTWDFRYESLIPVELQEREPGRYGSLASGALASPGKYAVQFHKVIAGKVTKLSEKNEFTIKSLDNATLVAEDLAAVNDFELKFSKMRRATRGLSKVYGSMNDRVKHLKKAVLQTPEAELELIEWLENLELQLKELGITLYGDRSLSSREFESKTSLSARIEITMGNIWGSTAKVPTWAETHYKEAGEILEDALETAAELEKEISKVEEQLYKQGAPYSKGSSFIPEWKLEAH